MLSSTRIVNVKRLVIFQCAKKPYRQFATEFLTNSIHTNLLNISKKKKWELATSSFRQFSTSRVMAQEPLCKSLTQKIDEGKVFLEESLPRLFEKVVSSYENKEGKVLEFLQPHELRKTIDFKVSDEPMSNSDLEALMHQAIHYSIKTGHPYYHNTLFTGVDRYALGGAVITESLNCSAYTYELSPVNTLIEDELIKTVGLEYLKFKQVDGIFAPGGSLANMYGVSLARQHKFPECKTKGMQGLPPVHIYTSKQSHYSLKKAAFFMGFGLDSVVEVETDSQGRMIAEALDKSIKNSLSNGYTPLMVNATSGTTVLGAYDPIRKISDVCKRHGDLWLHVDACWGGAVLFSDKLKYKMDGCELVDSLAWDPHKMTGAILQCAIFVTQHPGLLAETHCTKAKYLFMQDKIYDCSYDTGDKSIQCGRKIDAFKFWVQWKAYGNKLMAERIERNFENALYLRDRVRNTEGFRLVVEEPECTNVSFWYIPKRLRGIPETPEWWQEISKVAPAIKGRMQRAGSMMIAYQPEGELVNFLRMVCANAASTKEDMDYIVDNIVKLGEAE